MIVHETAGCYDNTALFINQVTAIHLASGKSVGLY
tara:strand:+ start:619 stop:723 length:105 start_codon:yes stop_codon:yes gene_type:complete